MPAASYTNAKRILKNSEAKISQSPEGIFDQNAVVLFWDNIEARFINECVNYLNDLNEQPVLAGPTQFYDTLFEESLYHLHAYYDEDADRPDPSTRQQRIYRIMMRNPVTYSADNWGETSTRWKLEEGNTATNGPSSLLTLSMANVTVEDALSFELQALAESYTDEIYLLRGIQLQGEWFSIRRRSEVNPKTGLYTLYWFLSKSLAEELYFTCQTGPETIKGFYYKWEATEDTLETLLKDTWFDNATGELATEFPETITVTGVGLPSDIANYPFASPEIGQDGAPAYVSGYSGTRFLYRIPPPFGAWKISDATPSFSNLYSCASIALDPPITGWTTVNGTGTITALIYPYTATLSEKVIGRTVVEKRLSRGEDDRLFDLEIEITWEFGSSGVVSSAGSTRLFGININPESSDALCKEKDGTMVAWPAFLAYLSDLRASTQIRQNPDGTINYEVVLVEEGAELTVVFMPNSSVVVSRTFKYGLDEAEVQAALQTTVISPPIDFIV